LKTLALSMDKDSQKAENKKKKDDKPAQVQPKEEEKKWEILQTIVLV